MTLTLPPTKKSLADVGYYMVGISTLPGFETISKLSSNETALGPSPHAIQAAQAAMETAHRYPELGTGPLPETLAARFDLDPKRIAFGPGSDEVLLRLISLYSGPGDEVVHSKNAYMQFPIYAMRAGSVPVAADDDDFRHSVDKILAAVTERTKIVIIANPDNPSGTYLPGDEVRRLHGALAEDVLLIIDGAYHEYAQAEGYEDPTALVHEADNVVMTRSFSKLYSLAGLRLGWCYGPPEVIDLMERVGPSFPVNSAANAAGIAAVEDRAHCDRVLAHNGKWIARLTEALPGCGLKVYPSQTNFVLVQFPSASEAEAADDNLKAHGIVGRKFALDDFADKLRFTVGLDHEMEAMIAVLEQFMAR
ncbi:MAG: histidinol-phosphate transaminase, partial [Pseudomonadota bacterium]